MDRRNGTPTSPGRRGGRVGEGVARAFAIASQMALLHPAEMDTWMRRELGAREGLARAGRRGR